MKLNFWGKFYDYFFISVWFKIFLNNLENDIYKYLLSSFWKSVFGNREDRYFIENSNGSNG